MKHFIAERSSQGSTMFSFFVGIKLFFIAQKRSSRGFTVLFCWHPEQLFPMLVGLKA
jgi:hypothetical protein